MILFMRRRLVTKMLKAELKKEFEENPFLNLNDAVFRLLYRSIIHLQLKPGSALSETALAKDLELSRTPIRNALLQLQKMGLVQREKGQSFLIAPLEKTECQQLMEARLAIEGYAAYLAAERLTPQQLEQLSDCMKAYREAFANWDVEAIVKHDHAFHQTMIDAAHNAFLSDTYRSLEPRVLHYRHFLFAHQEKGTIEPIMRESLRHHEAIYHAVKLGFSTVARDRMERDISGMVDIVKTW